MEMNKKLMALALAVLPACAMADVTIYGKFDIGLENNRENFTNGSSLATTRVDDYVSWLGFKGNEDLGNGLKAIWQVESAVWIDGSGTNGFGTRDTFVGLSGGFGTLRLGRISNAQRFPMKPDDDFWFSSTPTRGGANEPNIFTRTGYFVKNAVRYDSPDLAGFRASLQWSAGENKTAANSANDGYNIGLNYRNGPWLVEYGHDNQDNPAALANSKRATADTLSAGYTSNGLRAIVSYQRAQGWDWNDRGFIGPKAAASGLKTREVAASVSYDIGAFTPMLTWAHGANQQNDAGTINDSGYQQWILGLNYHLSKNTSAILSYGYLKFGDGMSNYNPYSDAPAGTGVRKETTSAIELRHFF
jgi:predicted porin